MRLAGKEPGRSRLAQAIRAAGFTHQRLLDQLPAYGGDISAWCYGRRPVAKQFRAKLCELIGWTAAQLGDFEREVGR